MNHVWFRIEDRLENLKKKLSRKRTPIGGIKFGSDEWMEGKAAGIKHALRIIKEERDKR